MVATSLLLPRGPVFSHRKEAQDLGVLDGVPRVALMMKRKESKAEQSGVSNPRCDLISWMISTWWQHLPSSGVVD